MPGIVLHHAQLVYWPIPKNACTSIKAFLADETLKLDTSTPFYPHDAAFEWTPDPIPGYSNLAFVRHPLARLYSLWTNKIAPGHPVEDFFGASIDPQVFGRHAANFFSEMLFPEFAFQIFSIRDGIDPHWAPQVTQFPNDCSIFQLECVRPILSALGIPKLNASPVSDWRWAYSPDLLNAALEYYREDFERCGYATEATLPEISNTYEI